MKTLTEKWNSLLIKELDKETLANSAMVECIAQQLENIENGDMEGWLKSACRNRLLRHFPRLPLFRACGVYGVTCAPGCSGHNEQKNTYIVGYPPDAKREVTIGEWYTENEIENNDVLNAKDIALSNIFSKIEIRFMQHWYECLRGKGGNVVTVEDDVRNAVETYLRLWFPSTKDILLAYPDGFVDVERIDREDHFIIDSIEGDIIPVRVKDEGNHYMESVAVIRNLYNLTYDESSGKYINKGSYGFGNFKIYTVLSVLGDARYRINKWKAVLESHIGSTIVRTQDMLMVANILDEQARCNRNFREDKYANAEKYEIADSYRDYFLPIWRQMLPKFLPLASFIYNEKQSSDDAYVNMKVPFRYPGKLGSIKIYPNYIETDVFEGLFSLLISETLLSVAFGVRNLVTWDTKRLNVTKFLDIVHEYAKAKDWGAPYAILGYVVGRCFGFEQVGKGVHSQCANTCIEYKGEVDGVHLYCTAGLVNECIIGNYDGDYPMSINMRKSIYMRDNAIQIDYNAELHMSALEDMVLFANREDIAGNRRKPDLVNIGNPLLSLISGLNSMGMPSSTLYLSRANIRAANRIKPMCNPCFYEIIGSYIDNSNIVGDIGDLPIYGAGYPNEAMQDNIRNALADKVNKYGDVRMNVKDLDIVVETVIRELGYQNDMDASAYAKFVVKEAYEAC